MLERVLLAAVERPQLRLHPLVRREEEGGTRGRAERCRHHAIVDAAEAAGLEEALRRLFRVVVGRVRRWCIRGASALLGIVRKRPHACILVRSVSSG